MVMMVSVSVIVSCYWLRRCIACCVAVLLFVIVYICRCKVRWHSDIQECGNKLTVEVEGEISIITA